MKGFITILVIVIIILIIVAVYMSRMKPKVPTSANGFIPPGTKPTDKGITTIIADGIIGTKPSNPDVFVITFKGGNRPAKGETYKALKKVRIREAGLFDGTYNTRPSWFMIDAKGNLGNIVVEGVKTGDYTGKVKIDLL